VNRSGQELIVSIRLCYHRAVYYYSLVDPNTASIGTYVSTVKLETYCMVGTQVPTFQNASVGRTILWCTIYNYLPTDTVYIGPTKSTKVPVHFFMFISCLCAALAVFLNLRKQISVHLGYFYKPNIVCNKFLQQNSWIRLHIRNANTTDQVAEYSPHQ